MYRLAYTVSNRKSELFWKGAALGLHLMHIFNNLCLFCTVTQLLRSLKRTQCLLKLTHSAIWLRCSALRCVAALPRAQLLAVKPLCARREHRTLTGLCQGSETFWCITWLCGSVPHRTGHQLSFELHLKISEDPFPENTSLSMWIKAPGPPHAQHRPSSLPPFVFGLYWPRQRWAAPAWPLDLAGLGSLQQQNWQQE